MAVYVRFWGTRGSIPTPGPKTQRYGGNTSCVELRTDEARIICDGGTGLRELGQELMREANGAALQMHLFFSHPHWDHIQGFPFFMPAYEPKNTIVVYGGADDDHVHGLLSGQMETRYFPVAFSELGAKIVSGHFEGDRTTVGDVLVRRFHQHHPGGSLGFAFQAEDVRVVYSTDNELDFLLEDMAAPVRDPHSPRRFPPEVLGPYRGADLVIADAQYNDDEYAKKTGWGHPRALTAVDLAIQAGVKQLALYHHDPMQSDADVDEKVRRCTERARKQKSRLVVFGAREGVTLKLG